MTAETLPPKPEEEKPWLALVICGKDDTQQIKKLGEKARELEGEIEKEVVVKIGTPKETPQKQVI